jgi:hypothetical protein
MVTRAGSTLIAAIVALAPAIAWAQLPPGMPNLEEMMRQQGMGAPGGPPAGRAGRPAAPAPPGVVAPADSPLIKAFERLDAAQAYRVVMDMTTTDSRMRQMMQQTGMGRMDKAVVRPDTQLVSFHMIMPAVEAPGQNDDFEVSAVIKGRRMARRFDSPQKDRILAYQQAQVDKQLAQMDAMAGMALVQALANGPLGAAGAATTIMAVAAGHSMAAASMKKAREFFEWSCSDRPADAQARSRDNVTFTDVVDLGDRTDGDVPVHGYTFFVREQGRYNGPVEVDVARGTGLPTRFVLADPDGRGTMIMRYSDYDQPATIEIPPCLAK